MTRYFLGVDGGQSSTTALIGDENGAVLGAGTGGPCNHAGALEGPAKLKKTILECVGKACLEAGLDAGSISFDCACLGMSGGPKDKSSLLAEVIRTPKLMVTDDAAIALSGALRGGPGVVTIAGTGSIAFGKNSDGRTARAGGWGYVFGDEGGAFDLVRQALRAALRFEEGWGPETALREALLEHTGMPSANELLHAFYTTEWPRSRVAAIAPLVGKIADAGDLAAVEVLSRAAKQLASIALAVRSQLWDVSQHVVFSFVGGVFQSSFLLDRFQSEVGFPVAPPLLGAACGALLEAYRAAGISPGLGKLLTSNF